MVPLTRHGAEVSSVFGLAGTNENDLTAALGFALAKCPPLAAAVTKRICAAAGTTPQGDLSLALEEHGAVGRTDLELKLGSSLFIIEAKRGWLLPGKPQLAQYAGRIKAAPGGGALVTLSQASPALAVQTLPSEVAGVPVIHLPWRDVLADVEAVRAGCRGHERLWLDEFNTYMNEVISMRRVEDSRTYCVVLNDAKPGGTFTYKQIVTEQLTYFHPYGAGGWPTEAPNFMAFRWGGAVQRIHRVIDHEVVARLSDRWPEITDPAADRPYAIYRLGPRLPPHEPIPNGATYRAARLWVLLDQLQTAGSLAAAIAGSKALETASSSSSAAAAPRSTRPVAVAAGQPPQLDDRHRVGVVGPVAAVAGTRCAAADLPRHRDAGLLHQQPRAPQHTERGQRPAVEAVRDRLLEVPQPHRVREQRQPRQAGIELFGDAVAAKRRSHRHPRAGHAPQERVDRHRDPFLAARDRPVEAAHWFGPTQQPELRRDRRGRGPFRQRRRRAHRQVGHVAGHPILSGLRNAGQLAAGLLQQLRRRARLLPQPLDTIAQDVTPLLA